MRFRDGMWLTQPDFRVEFAEDVHKIDTSKDDALSLLCPTRHIMARGNTLNQPTITIDVEPVVDDVISITARHWKGARDLGPHYPLFPDGKPGLKSSVTKTDAGTVLTAGKLACTISGAANTFDIRFTDAVTGAAVTSLEGRSVGLAYNPPPGSPMQLQDMTKFSHYMFTQHNLGVGESIFGLGERFTPFNKVGQAVTLYNADGGTSSEQAYKNVPFYLSSAGYGVFIDHPEPVELEIGSERTCRLQTSVKGQKIKWYLIYGPDPKEILRKYTDLTGKPAKVPSWSYGLWLSTSFTTNYDEATVGQFLDGMKEREIPVHVFHYDCFWMREFHWCDFVFSKEHFPDPKAMMSRLRTKYPGIKFCVWINPYIGDASPVFQEAADKGFLVKRTNGDVWQWDLWQAGMGLVDFTNPAACAWYTEKLEGLFDVGVDSLKTDFGERIPDTDVRWFDQSVDLAKMHNYYAYIYNEVVFRALQKRYGEDQAVLFSRSATAGTQRFPLQWGGDCESTYEAMAESLRGGLSLGLSGFAYWSVDIGGFEGRPRHDVYKRWVAFGLLCSHSRLHGSNSYRVPWAIDEASTPVLRTFVDLKCRLMPYIYAHSMAATKTGVPVSLRAMFLEFPEDPTAWTLDRQYMFGDALLIAPVFSESGEVTFYLPEGRWTSWFGGEVKHGPRWVTEKHGFESLPLYVREGTVLVLGKEGEKRVVYDYEQDAEVRVYSPTRGRPWRSTLLVDCEGDVRGKLEVEGATLKGLGLGGFNGKWSIVIDGMKADMEGETVTKFSW
ncbi:glycosyl hydrolases family 31-domain-containing protein [Geopyxis carbonaria]|nr:glycosyl hydrolases family 31-domain-containing protein [Geopyxis carbonaria]